MKTTRKQGRRPEEPEEIHARILSARRRYYVSRSDAAEKPFIDDEAEIEINAVIDLFNEATVSSGLNG